MKTLIVSDIHGNWSALQAVLAAESNVDQILCLGDLVNYGPQPAECVAWAMGLDPPSRVIQGNHDRAFGLDKASCAPADPPLAEAMQAATNDFLTVEMRNFLATLQPSQEFCRGSAKCIALHSLRTDIPDSYPDQYNPKWPWESDIMLLGHPDKLFVFAGHPDILLLAGSHMAFKTRWATTLVVNPGSVGLPLDGDPRAAYAVWDGADITIRRVEYNVEETVAALKGLKLDSQLTDYAAHGLRAGGNAIQRVETTVHNHERNTRKIDWTEAITETRTKRKRRSDLAFSN